MTETGRGRNSLDHNIIGSQQVRKVNFGMRQAARGSRGQQLCAFAYVAQDVLKHSNVTEPYYTPRRPRAGILEGPNCPLLAVRKGRCWDLILDQAVRATLRLSSRINPPTHLTTLIRRFSDIFASRRLTTLIPLPQRWDSGRWLLLARRTSILARTRAFTGFGYEG